MTNANLTYTAIAEFINSLQADRHEVAHAITLLAAQMPNASPTLIQVFLHAEGLNVMDHGKQLVRVNGMIDPHTAIHPSGMEVVEPEKITNHEMPDENEKPTVEVWEHPHREDGYCADKVNMKTLCSFHEVLPPAPEHFDEKGTDELILKLGYGHINGGFNLHFYRDPDQVAVVQLFGEFTLESFIPVRVVLIKPKG